MVQRSAITTDNCKRFVPPASRLAGSVALGRRLDSGAGERGFGAEGEAELSYLHRGSGLGSTGRGRC
jgi:hypothetical protein